jgi:hypothetical protein
VITYHGEENRVLHIAMYFIGRIWQLILWCRLILTWRRRMLGSIPQQRRMRRPIAAILVQLVEFFFYFFVGKCLRKN